MIARKTILSLGVSILSLGANAQSISSQISVPDSLFEEEVSDSVKASAEAFLEYYSNLRLKEEMRYDFEGTLSVARGLLSSYLNRDFHSIPACVNKSRSGNIVDYIPAVSPLAVAWILKAAGVKSVSTTRRMATATGMSLAMTIGLTELLKHTTGEMRPDGSDNQSMSSDHAAIAFASATILAREYGTISPWITVGGYSCALGTQVLRFKHNAHWANDLFVGAGLGMVSTNLAYFITDRIYGAKGINKFRMNRQLLLRAARFIDRPSGFYVVTGSEFMDNDIDINDNFQIRTSSVITTGVGASLFFNDKWGIQGMFRTTSAWAKVYSLNPAFYFVPTESGVVKGYPSSQIDFYQADIAGTFSYPVTLTTRLGVRGFAGVRHNTSYLVELPTDITYTEYEKAGIEAETRFQLGAGIDCEMFSNKSNVLGISIDYYHTFSDYMKNRISVCSYWKVLF